MKCQTQSCNSDAVARVFWPGREPMPMCAICAARAKTVASAIGCYVHAELMRPEEMLAKQEGEQP